MNEQIHQDDTQIDIESGYLATLRLISNFTPKGAVLKIDKFYSGIDIFTRHGWCKFYLKVYTVGVCFCTVGGGFLLKELHSWCYGGP